MKRPVVEGGERGIPEIVAVQRRDQTDGQQRADRQPDPFPASAQFFLMHPFVVSLPSAAGADEIINDARPFVKPQGRRGHGGNFSPLPSSQEYTVKKGEHIMDDLRYNPSALLLVGLLIAVIDVLI